MDDPQTPWTEHDTARAAKAIGEEVVGGMLSYPGTLFGEPGERMYCAPDRFPMQLVNLAAYMEAKCWDEQAAYTYVSAVANELHTVCFEFGPCAGNTRSQAYRPGDPLAKAKAVIRAATEVLIAR